jgi:hypothetical protein
MGGTRVQFNPHSRELKERMIASLDRLADHGSTVKRIEHNVFLVPLSPAKTFRSGLKPV